MLAYPLPLNEADRLASLASYQVLDTPPDPRTEVFTRLAVDIFDVPIALISLLDQERQWFKSCVGLDVSQTSRDVAFCTHAILDPRNVMVVEDATKDPRFAANPLVTGAPGIRFYAGAPIVTPDGFALGTLCIVDKMPRALNEQDRRRLADLACGVASVLELHRTAVQLRQIAEEDRAAHIAKSSFLATMSHEIRTPMNAVMGLAATLLESKLHDEQHKLVQAIYDSGDMLLRLINDVLDLSKLEAGRMTLDEAPFSPSVLTQSALSVLGPQAAAKGLLMRAECDPDVPAGLLGDAGRIRQVLLNLASNAVKFTEAGSVTVRAECLARDNAEAAIRWTVSDTGIGISSEQISKLFGEFVQADNTIARRFGGTGLGLAISKRLVTQMGGRISVHSTLGEGTTFEVDLTLPVTTEPRYAPSRQGDPTVAFQKMLARRPVRLRLLIAEDNSTNQFVMRQMLKPFDLLIDMVGDGREAVEAATRFRYDMILMDMRMPEMDGLRATRLIRQQGGRLAKVPVIALTANAFAEDMRACFEAGMNQFLPKPVSREMLLATLLQALAAPDPASHDASSQQEAPAATCDWTELLDLRTLMGVAAFDATLEVFAADAKAQLHRMAENLDKPTVIREASHSLGGAASAMYAMALAQRAKQIELIARKGGALSQDELTRMENELAAFLSAVEASKVTDFRPP